MRQNRNSPHTGWIRKQGRDVRELPMMIESHRIWRSFEEETGEDIGYAEGGCYFLAPTKKNVEKYESWMSTAREFELDTRVVQGDELAKHIENTSQTWPGALYTASDGRAEPHKATPAIARLASRLGATIAILFIHLWINKGCKLSETVVFSYRVFCLVQDLVHHSRQLRCR